MAMEKREILSALRQALSARNLDVWLQPINDEFQGEYVPHYAMRLPYISNFSGSAGLAIIPADTSLPCVLLVDGRYVAQAASEINSRDWIFFNIADVNPFDWMGQHLTRAAKIACDAWLHTQAQIEIWQKSAMRHGFELHPLRENLIDTIWQKKPLPPVSDIMVLDEVYTGVSISHKITQLIAHIADKNFDAIIITQPDAVCWLLNIRANDIAYNPLLLSYAIVWRDKSVLLLTHPRTLSVEIHTYFQQNNVTCLTFSDWFSDNSPACARYNLAGKNFGIDHILSSHAWWQWAIDVNTTLVTHEDPLQRMKACKNRVEQQGMRIAHQKDAIAIIQFLSRLPLSNPSAMPSEITLTQQLEKERQKMEGYQGPSFATIAGTGAHGAIVHYHATTDTDRTGLAGELLLLDSGGQYFEGTTDITRTMAIGDGDTIATEIKDRYTRVLKGHIALATARFIRGTSGRQLDTLARQYLWQVGCDYDHGTGHGVGSFLCVHEGPQRISKKSSDIALAEGMVISNEPGYYEPQAYGIRIENLVLVVATDRKNVLAFETLTLVPIATNLVIIAMLTADEIAWINQYHAAIWEKLAPHLKDETSKAWLKAACQPLMH